MNTHKTIKLDYIGRMDVPGFPGDLRLWNVIAPGNPYHHSSRTLEGLKELGIVK